MKSRLRCLFFVTFVFLIILISGDYFSAVASQRIISLAPNLTEIVFALGLGDELVGDTLQCDFPEAAKKIQKIGEMSAPNAELIIKANPTLVVATEGNSREVLNKLIKSKIKVLEVHAKSATELPEMIKKLAKELGRAEQGQKIATKIEASLEKLIAKGLSRKTKKAKKFLLTLQFNPVYSVTNKTWLGDLLAKTGLQNIVPDGPINYPQLSKEFIIKENPDIIFIEPMILTHAKNPQDEITLNLEKLFARKSALPLAVIFPPDILVRPGPRLSEGIEFLLTNDKINSL